MQSNIDKITSPSNIFDFQGTNGIKIFSRFVKLGDSLILAKLLLEHTIIQSKKRKNESLLIHDIGGAEGEMMLTLLQVLNLQADVTVNEPVYERMIQYRQKKINYPDLFLSIDISDKKMNYQDFYIWPQKEIILASHVLYYNREQWSSCESIKGHFFTHLFRSLCIGGILCVILQQSAIENTNSHESWEDFIYPVLKMSKYGIDKFYATAEQFATALSYYRKQFLYEFNTAIDWKIKTEVAVTKVPIGKLNTTPDSHDGHYRQTTDVLEVLRFYLQGFLLTDLEIATQKLVVDYLTTHCVDQDQCAIIHYNKIYTIEPGPIFFAKLDSLINEEATEAAPAK